MQTTAKRTCSNARDELRHDPLSGEFYETGYVLTCPNPVDDEEECYCRRCREENAS